MRCVGSRAADDVMQLMRNDASDGPAEQQIVSRRVTNLRRGQRVANAVALDISERDHVTVRNVRVGESHGLAGQRSCVSCRLAISMKFDHDQAGKRIRRGKLIELAPVQFHSGASHLRLSSRFISLMDGSE